MACAGQQGPTFTSVRIDKSVRQNFNKPCYMQLHIGEDTYILNRAKALTHKMDEKISACGKKWIHLVVSRVVIELETHMHLPRVPELKLRESGERRAAMWLQNGRWQRQECD